MRFRLTHTYWPALFYAAASLVIFLPLLTPGFVLVLDMVFTPSLPFPKEITNTYPFYLFLHVLDRILPADLIQKIMLLGTFFLAGYGAYALLQHLSPKPNNTRLWIVASSVGGLLYMYNPFTYTRLMSGQYLVLIGFALLPLFIRQLLLFVAKPDIRSALSVAALMTVIAFTSIHTLVFAVLVGMVVVGLHIIRIVRQKKQKEAMKPLFLYGLGASGAVLALNSFWILSVLKGDSPLTTAVSNFTKNDLQAFATDPGERGVVTNVLGLQGFWGDNENLYLLPQDLTSFWWLPVIILWSLVLLGIIWSWRHQRYYASLFSIIGLVGLIVATGVWGSPFAAVNNWLYENVALFNGFREPQKFVALLVLSYSYFASVGLYWLWGSFKNGYARRTAVTAALLVPIACTPLLPWGASGQLQSVPYPDTWHKANHFLNNERSPDDKAIVIPWHLYMPLRFSSGVVANPAEQFFDIPVITSKDPELEGAAPYEYDKTRELVTQALLQRKSDTLIHALQNQNIRYIILIKEFDYRDYDYLGTHPHLNVISDDKEITIYGVEFTKGEV